MSEKHVNCNRNFCNFIYISNDRRDDNKITDTKEKDYKRKTIISSLGTLILNIGQ